MALRLLNDVVSRDEYVVGHTSPLYSILFYSFYGKKSIGNPAIQIKSFDGNHQFSMADLREIRQNRQKLNGKMVQTVIPEFERPFCGRSAAAESGFRRNPGRKTGPFLPAAGGNCEKDGSVSACRKYFHGIPELCAEKNCENLLITDKEHDNISVLQVHPAQCGEKFRGLCLTKHTVRRYIYEVFQENRKVRSFPHA